MRTTDCRRFSRPARLLLVTCVVSAFAAGPAFGQEDNRCAGSTAGPPATAPPPTTEGLSKVQERSLQFAFGGDREPSDRTVGIEATPSLRPGVRIFAELAGDLERADGGDSFPVEGIVAQTSTTEQGNVRLIVCLDPSQPENVTPGRYVGTVKLSGPQIEPTAITLEATLRRGTPIAVAVLLMGILVGLALKALGDRKATTETMRAMGQPGSGAPTFKWKDYLAGGEFYTSLLIALLLAALAYAQIYYSDPDWGTPLDIITLGLAGVAAVISGKTAVDIVAPYVPK